MEMKNEIEKGDPALDYILDMGGAEEFVEQYFEDQADATKPTEKQLERLRKLNVSEEDIAKLDRGGAGELIRKLVESRVYHQPYPCKECGTTHALMHHITYDEFRRRQEAAKENAQTR